MERGEQRPTAMKDRSTCIASRSGRVATIGNIVVQNTGDVKTDEFAFGVFVLGRRLTLQAAGNISCSGSELP